MGPRGIGQLAFVHGLLAKTTLFALGPGGTDRLPCREGKAESEGRDDGCPGGKRDPVPTNGLHEPISLARGPREHRLLVKVTLNILREPVHRFVAARAILLE